MTTDVAAIMPLRVHERAAPAQETPGLRAARFERDAVPYWEQALLLAAAAVTGVGGLPLLACAAAALAVGAAGLCAAERCGGALSRWLSRHHRRSPAIARLAAAIAAVSRQRPGFRLGVGAPACTCAGLLADAGVLAACFGLAGLPVPWRGLLFAYAAG
jgi:hypothetical protein